MSWLEIIGVIAVYIVVAYGGLVLTSILVSRKEGMLGLVAAGVVFIYGGIGLSAIGVLGVGVLVGIKLAS